MRFGGLWHAEPWHFLFRCNFARRVDAGNDGKIVVGRAWQFDLHKKAWSAQMPQFFFN